MSAQTWVLRDGKWVLDRTVTSGEAFDPNRELVIDCRKR